MFHVKQFLSGVWNVSRETIFMGVWNVSRETLWMEL